MNRALGLMFAAAVASGVGAATGCGDNLGPPVLKPDQVLSLLRALPGVTAREESTEQAGFHYYVLHFTQWVDHDDPSLGTFQQEVSLLHRSELESVPMIVQTSGYADYNLDEPVELTRLLGANQVAIEHRYFGESRPVPTDWTKLTIEQMAADEHEIITSLRSVYRGAFITTGGSKGGMTAVYHRRFYPDDVDGTVAYVAPLSFGAPDRRYPPFLETLGNAVCREAVRNVAIQLLSSHREAMCEHAEHQTAHQYTRIAVGPAVESAIVNLEWTFWQYFGVDECGHVPPMIAGEDELFAFLDKISPVSDNDDEKIGYFEPYYYQAYAQLGYPDGGAQYLAPYLWFTDEAYAGELPVPEPEYDSNAMRDIDDFVEHRGERLLFIYGQWDPWTRGQFLLGKAVDSDVLIQPQGTHAARIGTLELSDREVAYAKLKAWTGVTPMPLKARRASAVARSAADVPTRLPPAMARALRARK